MRRGFTLIELLITMAIIGIMAGMVLFAASSAMETAKVSKTKALVAKLDSIIKSRWDAYKTRRVPVQIAAGTTPGNAAIIRLTALRDLMRMEMPDRWSDVQDDPVALPFSYPAMNRPAINQGYFRKFSAKTPTGTFAGAECLYMIVMNAVADEGDAREVFKPDDVADTDGDGYPEFVDAWKQPIKFLRWAPGFQFSELQVIAQFTNATAAGMGALTLPATASTDASAYVGGAVIGIDANTTAFDTNLMARVTKYLPPGAITFAAPTGSPPTIPGPSNVVLLTAPDGLDPLGVAVASVSGGPPNSIGSPTFQLYPLIYSSGPDKCYGILADFSGAAGAALQYSGTTTPLSGFYTPAGTTANINPFCIRPDAANSNLPSLIGSARNDPAEPNYVPSAWLDNIHNHLLNQR